MASTTATGMFDVMVAKWSRAKLCKNEFWRGLLLPGFLAKATFRRWFFGSVFQLPVPAAILSKQIFDRGGQIAESAAAFRFWDGY